MHNGKIESRRETLVLYDVGAVLLALNYNGFYEKAAERSGSMNTEEFKKRYIASKLEERSLKGEIGNRTYLDGLRNIISSEQKISDKELKDIISNCWTGPIAEMVRLKKRCYDSGYAVGLFSNMGELGLEILSAKYSEIFETFDASFPKIYSYEMGHIKPDIKAYEAVPKYKKVIFIDDKASYLKAGIDTFGWYGILFTPYQDPSEAIRSSPAHGDAENPSKNFEVADSVNDAVEALRAFGLEI